MCAAVLMLTPTPGGVSLAEGCSGAGNQSPKHCTTTGWSEIAWQVPPDGVPTDGVVRVSMTAPATCTPGSGGMGPTSASVTVVVKGPDGKAVPGSPSSPIPGPPSAFSSASSPSTTSKLIEWRPMGQLAPETTYTLTVEGLTGGDRSLSFKTGAGPYGIPAPVLFEPSLEASPKSSGPSVCCTRFTTNPSTSCGGPTSTCAFAETGNVAVIRSGVDLPAATPAEQAYLDRRVEVSIDDGPWSESSELPPGATKACIRATAKNLLTGEVGVSEPWCATTAGLDLSMKPNCEELQKVLAACKGGAGGSPALLDPAEAASLVAAKCPGGTGTAGGSENPADDGGSGGCSTGAVVPGFGGALGLLVALGAAARRRGRR